MGPGDDVDVALINLAMKGRKFPDDLVDRQDFAKDRQIGRCGRRALVHHGVVVDEEGKEYGINVHAYRKELAEMLKR